MKDKKILVIDDEPGVRKLLRLSLEDEGCSVLLAENGSEGLELCRTTTVDAVITDIVMPDSEGLETIRRLRKEFPEIKIIAMSGAFSLNKNGYHREATAFGAFKFLRKPFEASDLVAALREAFGLITIPNCTELPLEQQSE